jgi:energy-coupling factor transporter ATP-binding protein EcfA2
MYLKSGISKLIKGLGYDIQKTPQVGKDKPNRSKGQIIEMLGPSGVGKTTLYKCVLAKYHQDWHTSRQLRALVALDTEGLSLDSTPLKEIYAVLLKNKAINVWDSDRSVEEKYRRLKYMIDEVAVDRIANSQDLSKGVLSDNGLTHNFGEEIIALEHKLKEKELPSISKEGMQAFFRCRSIILVTASTDYIKYNLKKRNLDLKKSGRSNNPNNYYRTIGKNYLEDYIRSIFDENKKMIEIAEKYGAGILTIDVETEKIHEIGQKIDDFIERSMVRRSLL